MNHAPGPSGSSLGSCARRGLACALCACLLAVQSAVGADGERRGSAPAADVQDLVFLGPMRPLLLRLHVTIDGRPFRQAWQERFDELFAQEDRQQTGRLTLDQARSLVRDMNGSLKDDPKTDLKAAVGSETVDRAALLAYLNGNLPPFVVRRRAVIDRTAAQALFPLLDTDGNHQLSAAELAVAADQVKPRDFNDDGAITPAELILDPNAIAATADPAGADRALDPEDSPVMLIEPSTLGAQIADKLLRHYDRNRDGRLTTVAPELEIHLPAELMGRFDANGDGVLDREELDAFADRTPDVELFFPMGRMSAAERRRRPAPPSDSTFRVRRTLEDGYDLGASARPTLSFCALIGTRDRQTW